MFSGPTGLLWFLSDNGLLSFDGHRWSTPVTISDTAERTYRKIQRRRGKGDASMALDWIQGLINAKRDSRDGPSDGEKHLRSSARDEITMGLQDKEGLIWIGAEKGILRLDWKSREWKVYPLPDQLVEASCIYADRSACLWVTDDHGNVAAYDKKTDVWKSYSLNSLLPAHETDTVVQAMYRDRHGWDMILGTNRGLVILSETEPKWRILMTHNSGILDNRVTSITEDMNGRIWIGTGASIVVLEK